MDSRRTFLGKFATAVGLTLVPLPFNVVARTASGRWAPSILRVSTPALRATWPPCIRISLQVARANAARGIAGAAVAAATLLNTLRSRSGHPWYDPAFRPSLRSPVTGLQR